MMPVFSLGGTHKSDEGSNVVSLGGCLHCNLAMALPKCSLHFEQIANCAQSALQCVRGNQRMCIRRKLAELEQLVQRAHVST